MYPKDKHFRFFTETTLLIHFALRFEKRAKKLSRLFYVRERQQMGITTDAILADVAKSIGFDSMREHTKLKNVWIMEKTRSSSYLSYLVVAFDDQTGDCHLRYGVERSEALEHFEKTFNLIFKEKTLYRVSDYAGFADEVMSEYESGRMTIKECYAFLDKLMNP
jgi:hypothetical protein